MLGEGTSFLLLSDEQLFEGTTGRVDWQLHASSQPPLPTAPLAAVPPQATRYWALVGLGATTAAAGSGLLVFARERAEHASEQGCFTNDPALWDQYQALYERAQSMHRVGVILTGAGAAATLTGLVLPTRSASVQPMIGPAGAGLQVSWTQGRGK